MNALDEALDARLDTPADREAIRDRLATDPAFAAAFARATRLLRVCRDDVDARVPPSAFVLDALEAQGCADALSGAERAVLTDVKAELETADDGAPETAIRSRSHADADFFSQCWVEAALSARKQRVDREAVRSVRRGRTSSRWVWRTAVGAALVAFAVLAVLLVQRDLGTTTIRVAENETARLVTLADGSTARLYPGSTLSYVDPTSRSPFGRSVSLQGRALFDVTSGSTFIVRTDEARISVLGTTFAVNDEAQETTVTLIDGRLVVSSVEAADRVVTLESGEFSRVRSGAFPTTPQPLVLGETLAWSGVLFFRETTMRDAVSRISSRFGVTVSVSSALADEPVTATFQPDETVEDVLGALALTLGANVETMDDGYSIR